MKKLEENKYLLVIIVILIISSLLICFKLFKKEDKNNEVSFIDITTTKKEIINKNYVDIKGSVNNPGVYEFKENDRVIDAINLAGGLTKDANTSNINLSKKLTSEMVIYIYNNNEIKNNTKSLTCDNVCKTEIIEVNNCIEITTNKNLETERTDLININTASLDDLMTLSGVGESKAKNIIEYRKDNNFNSIEDIKNISGIGEALFNKIKDRITV